MPIPPSVAAIGKLKDNDSSFTITAKMIKKNDWVNATTGETNETAPVEIAL